MNFKKPFKVLTTAALVGTLTLTSVSTSTFAKETTLKSIVEQKASTEIESLVLTNGETKISLPFMEYALVAGDVTALNGYEVEYVTSSNNKSYTFMNYALFSVDLDSAEKIIGALDEANLAVELPEMKEGQFVDGKLTVKTDENKLTAPKSIVETGTTTTLSDKGTYGGTKDNPQVIEGNLTITNSHVNLSNVVIKGNLTIADSVGTGDIIIDNTTVEGNTYVKGGGMNSIHFQDSVIATVIVNKNDGTVRVVVSGNTYVEDVRLESYAKLEEENLTDSSDGFTDVRIDPTVQASQGGLEAIEFVGDYETINSKAQSVKINLSEGTTVEKIALDAIAAVIGSGRINRAEINSNASGSVFDQTLTNIVLNNGAYVTANGEEIYNSTSSAETAELKNVELTPDSIRIELSDYVSHISGNDFKLDASIDGEPVELEDVYYNEEMQRLFFTPLVNGETIGHKLKVTVTPKEKLTGSPIMTEEIILQEGFSGRITDVQEVGLAGANLKFTNYETEEEYTATTDSRGYYYVNAPAGEYNGLITGSNIVTTRIYPYTTTNRFLTNQNETAIATAASSELKIVVDWGKYPYDVDSHLVGLDSSGEPFHVYYGDRIHEDNNQTDVDLDWDDRNSYGPETTTFRKLKDGQYIFYLYNFSGNYDSTLAKSGAKVKVFKGDSTVADYELAIEDLADDNTDRFYYAYGIEISDNGQNIKVVPIDKFDKEVSSKKTANLKTYLPTLIDLSTQLLEAYAESDAEEKVILQDALNTAKEADIETLDFENLIDTALSLKIAYSNFKSAVGEGIDSTNDDDNWYDEY